MNRTVIVALVLAAGCGLRSPIALKNPLPLPQSERDYAEIREMTLEEVEARLEDVERDHEDVENLQQMLYNRMEQLQDEAMFEAETFDLPPVSTALVASPGASPDLRASAVTPLDAAGDTVEWDYAMSLIPSGCPDPMNPQLDPGCEVSRFMIWDGLAWWDAGMVPGPDPDTFRFTFPNQYDPAKTQIQACNDIGTMMGQWDAEDGCSRGGGRLFEIAPPTNPRFFP